MRRIAAAVAAITLVANTAHAQGQGQGKGSDRGGGESAAAGQRAGNGSDRDNGERRNRGRADTGPGPSTAQSMRGPEQRGYGEAMRDQRGADRGNAGKDRAPGQRADRNERGRGNDDRAISIAHPASDRGTAVRARGRGFGFPLGLIDGCPPGLAKKRNGCEPPGQARRDDWRVTFDRPDFWGLTQLAAGNYFYDDGYLVRYAPSGGILGYVPLLGGALSVGNAWPEYYEPVALPGYYERYYGLGPARSYRYADDVIYRVDPETAAITSIAALLTGDEFEVGRPMPIGYEVYNVPYGYRDRYVDGPDAYYRYSDGHIYQVDPETRLIASAIELLAS